MEQIFYGITLTVYGIFIVRFILSWIGGDFELDADSDTDLDLGDVISFKGLTHFLMGFFGWLSTKSFITHNIQWYDFAIAFVAGILFVYILYWAYKLMLKLETKPEVLIGKELVGHNAKIYLLDYLEMDEKNYHYQVLVNNGVGTIEVTGISSKEFKVGDTVILSNYDGNYYTLI